MKPASAERASETRLTPGQVGERIRAMRLERGWRQADLAELVNVTQPYVGMIERGTISHPSSDVREAFALALGENAFGDFGLALEAREGTLGLVDAAAYLGVDHVTLRESEIACRREGHRYEYAIDELDAARDKYRCSEPGCDRIALGRSGGCQAHGHAILQRGTTRSSEIRERMSASHRATHADPERGVRWRAAISTANRGRKRDDVRERVAEMHADSKQHAEWGLALVEGRAQGKRREVIPGTVIRRWKNRVNGHKGNRPPNAERDGYREAVDMVLELHEANPRLGERELARRATRELGTDVSRHLVREALGRR